MNNSSTDRTKYTVRIALLAAIEILLAVTPLGYIPIGVVRATTIHIPVIIGGALLGYRAGAVLGGVFGLSSLIINTMSPTVTSFVFSPFYRTGEFGGNGWSVVIAMLPRIMIGIVAAAVFRAAMKLTRERSAVSGAVAGLLASMTNTVLVMGGIYVFFGRQYAAAREISYGSLLAVIGGVISINGVIEAIAAAVISGAVIAVLKKTMRL